MSIRNILLATTFTAASAATSAAPIFYFGDDLGWYNNNISTNSEVASTAFQSALTGVGTETFESFSDGQTGPLAVSFGAAGTATLSGSGEVQSAIGYGRKAYSGTTFWEASSSDFSILFSESIAAFGFYGIDLGDFSGQVTIELTGGDVETYDIPHTTGSSGSTNGNLLFWGVIDLENTFSSITFSNTGSGGDVFGFDNFTIGTSEQVVTNDVPAPTSIALLVAGLLGLRLARKTA